MPPHSAKVGLANLATDVLLEIIQFLEIHEILRFRQTNKHIARATRTGIVWKRALRHLTIPLPHQPRPIHALTAAQAEALVQRAVHLDRNWRSNDPKPVASFFDSFDKTMDIKLAPGGKYAVLANRDYSGMQHSLVVWDLEHERGRVALAKIGTKTAISALRVKSGVVHGQPGIIIVYLRPVDDKKTEICVLHVAFSALEQLARPPDERLPLSEPPFRALTNVRARCQLGGISIEPHLIAIIHRPRTILFLDTGSHARSFLKLKGFHDDQRHSIWAVRILPAQNEVLVIRSMQNQAETVYVFETYTIPPLETTVDGPEPNQRQFCEHMVAHTFSISQTSYHQPPTDMPSPEEAARHQFFFATISIYAITDEPRGVIHWTLPPTRNTPAAIIQGGPEYVYRLPAVFASQYLFETDEQKATILPGAERSLWWTRPFGSRAEAPSMMGIYGYQTMPQGEASLRRLALTNAVAQAVGEGTQSVAFDEGSGRVCFATSLDSKVHVLDYGFYFPR